MHQSFFLGGLDSVIFVAKVQAECKRVTKGNAYGNPCSLGYNISKRGEWMWQTLPVDISNG